MTQLIECVPNFSEGCNTQIIEQIANEIKSIDGIKVLHIDPGKAANRTVITFVGPPKAVVEAALLSIKKAAELIDMRIQRGEHPRIGSTDVCPLIPISGITMEETVKFSKLLGQKVASELNIPVYLYEESQPNKSRSNLADIRRGEYENLSKKVQLNEWKPDYGPSENFEKTGATVIGARNFLVAYNINLNTTSVELAKKIARSVRESNGNLKSVKAIGWFIKEYNFAQVSMNLTNINITTVHEAFEEVSKLAIDLGVEVTGSELIGLIPIQAMLEAGIFYKNKFNLKDNNSKNELIKLAIQYLGLNQLSKFKPEERIIEYLIK